MLVLPGMMLDARMWDLPDDLQALHADLTAGETISEMADQVLSAAPPRFSLAGFSLGAIVSLEIWRRAPERVLALALIGLNPGPDPQERRQTRLVQIERADADGLEGLMHEIFLPRYFATQQAARTLSGRVIEMARDLGPEVFRRQTMAQLTRPDGRATLATITAPTLVMCGAEDRMTDAALHRRTADAIPHARLETVAGAGHLAPMERPDKIGARLTSFFDAVAWQ